MVQIQTRRKTLRHSQLVMQLWAMAIAIGVMPGIVLGADPDLASKATNPIGDVVQVQLQDQYSPNSWGGGGHSNTAIVQPVIPFKTSWESMPTVITRTTIPYVTTTEIPGVGRQNNLGDTVFLGFGLPKLETKGVMLGIGPALSLPTGNDYTGSGKWSAGPTVVYINLQTKKLLWGALYYQLFSFAGDSDRDSVNQLNVQPIVNKFFDEGWYVRLQDVPWVYNDKTGDWNMPMGPMVGRVTKIGTQSVNIYAGAFYNPVSTTGTAKWSFKLSVSLLFPK